MNINIQHNIGTAKYVVNFSDGTKRHPDGSEFFDIAIFHNKKKMDAFVSELQGYKQRKLRFTKSDINGIEWTHPVTLNTSDGHYRVEIHWALDRYRVYVWRRVQEPEKFVRAHVAWHPRTALKTANRMLREYAKRDH